MRRCSGCDMELMLDTHIALWIFTNDGRLSRQARAIVDDAGNNFYCSVVSMWEVAIKHRRKRSAMPISGAEFLHYCAQAGFKGIPVFDRHIAELEGLGGNSLFPEHRDPFDRLLLAQARCERMRFLTHDKVFTGYGEDCVLVV